MTVRRTARALGTKLEVFERLQYDIAVIHVMRRKQLPWRATGAVRACVIS